jgi:hypothetical protein
MNREAPPFRFTSTARAASIDAAGVLLADDHLRVEYAPGQFVQPKGLAGLRQDFVGNIQQGGRHRVSKRIV